MTNKCLAKLCSGIVICFFGYIFFINPCLAAPKRLPEFEKREDAAREREPEIPDPVEAYRRLGTDFERRQYILLYNQFMRVHEFSEDILAGRLDRVRTFIQAHPNLHNFIHNSGVQLIGIIRESPRVALPKLKEFLIQSVRGTNYFPRDIYPLHVAAFARFPRILELLLENGFDPNFTSTQGRTPLHQAAEAGWAEGIGILLRHGARLENRHESSVTTPLILAASKGWVGTVLFLLDSGARIDEEDERGQTALWHAIANNKGPVVAALLDYEPNLRDRSRFHSYLAVADRYQAADSALELLRHSYSSQYFRANIRDSFNLICLKAYFELVRIDSSQALQKFRRKYFESPFFEEFSLDWKDLLSDTYFELYLQEGEKDLDADQKGKASSILRTCLACFDQVREPPSKNIGPADCSCFLCSDCAKDFIKSCFAHLGLEVPQCPGCKGVVDSHYLISHEFSKEDRVRFCELKMQLLTRRDPNFRPCPTRDCVGGRIISETSKFFACEFCDFHGCLGCGKDHRGSCKDQQRTDEFLAKVVREGKLAPPSTYPASPEEPGYYHGRYRPCYWCGLLQEYVEGCNALGCGKCGKRFHRNLGLQRDPELHDGTKDIQRYEPLKPAHFSH